MLAASLTCAGLFTYPNDLSQVPVGALLEADNFVINRDGSAETRRGEALTGSNLSLPASTYIDNWFSYQNRLIISTNHGLQYDSTGTQVWTAYSGTFNAPTGSPKIHGLEMNKNMYFTTALGVYKTDLLTTSPTLSGIPAALNGSAALTGVSGFLGTASQAVYQIVFGTTDANNNLNLGNPSQRISIINSSVADTANVNVTFRIPSGLTTSYFYQVYRTPQTVYSATPSSNIPPGSELQLVAQINLTSGNISAGTVTYLDATPDTLLGAFLYTNPSQQGIAQTNDQPPLCVDFCLFNGMTLYANVETRQALTFTLLGTGSPNGIQINDTVVINGITFTGKASENVASKQFLVETGGTVSSNISATANSLVNCINGNVATTNVYAYYVSGFNELPGRIYVQAKDFSVSSFAVTSSRGGAFLPNLPPSGTSFSSSADVLPNGIYISKSNQPEAVPLVNLLFVGGGDQPIYRVLPLRDRVIVFKSDGVFTITGSTPATLTVTLLDNTVIVNAPESVRLLNNTAFAMTEQGVVAVNESGVSIKSRPIEGDILQVTASQYTNFSSVTHAISYESERIYVLNTVSATGDTYPTQAYVYSWVTNAWTRWPVSYVSGLVNPFDNLLYVANANNPSYAYKERKNFAVSDYVDDVIAVTISSFSITTVVVSSTASYWVGGYLSQAGNLSLITAVNTGTNTLTVEDTISWSLAAAEVQIPIEYALEWTPQTAGFPHFQKKWGRVKFWLGAGYFTNINASFITDLDPTEADVPLTLLTGDYWGKGATWGVPTLWGDETVSPQEVTTLTTPNKQSSHWIQAGVFGGFPYNHVIILGCSFSYDVISDVAR